MTTYEQRPEDEDDSAGAQGQAERLTRKVTESAQQV